MRRLFLIAILVPPQAIAQPYSHSMAQCSALAYAMSEWTNQQETYEQTLDMSQIWFDAALEQASVEGLDKAYEVLTNIANEAENEWLSKGRTAVFSGEFRDWVTYCGSFAEHLGIEFPEL